MEKKELEKIVDTLFKEHCANIIIPNYKIRVSKRWIKIIGNNKTVEGDIYYGYLSPRFCQLGAITTLHLRGSIANGLIGQILTNIDSHPRYPLRTGYYEFPRTTKYIGGPDFSFYQTDNIEERINFLIEPIKNDIIPRFDNFLNCKEGLIEDVLSKPDYYKCPYAIALIMLYLNNKNTEDNIKVLREEATKAKLKDMKMASMIEEKVFQYFSDL